VKARTILAPMALSLLLAPFLAGCVTGRPLVLPKESIRPGTCEAGAAAPPSVAGLVVAVRDFHPADREEAEVGRDYDNVRPVRFPGNPGKTYADIFARVLSDRGWTVRRIAAGEAAPAGALVVSGTLVEFRADVKRPWFLKVETAARVSVDMRVEGGPLASPWTGNVVADVWSPQAFFVNPEKAGSALSDASCAAAGEGVDRLARLLQSSPAGVPPATNPAR
jgi:hypothetical protein